MMRILKWSIEIPMKFWHVTSSDLVESILREGLRPGAYLIAEDRAEIRDYYAETVADEGNVPVILVVDADRLSVRNFTPDQNGLDEPLTHTLGMTEDDVREAFDATGGTWRDCIEVIGTCRYMGTVPSAALSVRGEEQVRESVRD